MDKPDNSIEQPVETTVDKAGVLFKRATALCFIFMILFGNYLLILNLTGQPVSGLEFDIWLGIVGFTIASGLGYIFLAVLPKVFGENTKNH